MHQRRHAYRITGVFHEHQKGATVRAQATVQTQAVLDGSHTEFTHAVVDVVATGIVGSDRLAAFPDGVVGPGQVSGAASQFRQQRTESVQGILTRLAGSDLVAFFLALTDIGIRLVGKVCRQFTRLPTQKLRRQLRVRGLIGVETLLPFALRLGTRFLGIPGILDVRRDFKRAVLPTQLFTGQGDFIFPQSGTMGVFLALLVGAAETDNGLAANQGGLIRIGAGILHRHSNFFRVVAVHIGDHLPAVGAETLHGIVGKPAFHFTVDGNAVVVIKRHQLAQAQGASQGSHLVGDAFHHAAITQETVGIVVHHGVPFAVELPRQHFLGQRHAHGIGQALTQWAGGGFNARRVTVFRVSGGGTAQLAEVLDVIQADTVTGQMQ